MVEWIVPDWPAPSRVRSLVTTRQGGVSQGERASLNLAEHVGDDASAVAENRKRLRRHLPSEPVWLSQVHGDRRGRCRPDHCGCDRATPPWHVRPAPCVPS